MGYGTMGSENSNAAREVTGYSLVYSLVYLHRIIFRRLRTNYSSCAIYFTRSLARLLAHCLHWSWSLWKKVSSSFPLPHIIDIIEIIDKIDTYNEFHYFEEKFFETWMEMNYESVLHMRKRILVAIRITPDFKGRLIILCAYSEQFLSKACWLFVGDS